MGHHYDVSDENWNEICELVNGGWWNIDSFIRDAIETAIYNEKESRRQRIERAATDNCGDGREN